MIYVVIKIHCQFANARCHAHMTYHIPDESECANKQCEAGKFSCKSNGECIPEKWQCDGEKDCLDGTDEKNCEYPEVHCDAGEFKCKTGRLW